MRALDRRLLAYARDATRTFLLVSVALGVLSALLIVTQAWLLADVVARAFLDGRSLEQLHVPLVVLLLVVLARATVAWQAELAASRSSARAKSQLRAALLARIATLGQEHSREQRTGELTVLATRGIDALDGYFSLYLPQLLLAVIVPVVVIVVVLWNDWISAAIIAFTIPLIPLFMALVGAATKERMDSQFRTLERLAGHFLDVVAGLPTLKVFGRAKAQAAAIREITERYRRAAISTLRITFLSSLILELVATISVALVAVAIGLRLMDGAARSAHRAVRARARARRPTCRCAGWAPTTTRAPRAWPPRSRCLPCWRRPRCPVARVSTSPTRRSPASPSRGCGSATPAAQSRRSTASR